MSTIATQLEGVEKEIISCEQQLDNVQRSLRLRSLTLSERNDLETEEADLKKEIKLHDKRRRDLQKENWKSALLSVLLLILVVLVYKYIICS